MKPGITYHCGPTDFSVYIKVAGHVTRIELAPLGRDRRAKLMTSLFDWRNAGYKGYPDIQQFASEQI